MESDSRSAPVMAAAGLGGGGGSVIATVLRPGADSV